MHTELPRFVTGGGHHAASAQTADDQRFAPQGRIVVRFDRSVERIHVDMEDGASARHGGSVATPGAARRRLHALQAEFHSYSAGDDRAVDSSLAEPSRAAKISRVADARGARLLFGLAARGELFGSEVVDVHDVHYAAIVVEEHRGLGLREDAGGQRLLNLP